MTFPETGAYVVPGALVPVEIDHERDEGLYVEPFRRGVGIAKLLCATIEAWTSNLGCTELASDVLLNNVTGQNAHKRLGFKETERVVYFVKRL